MTGAVHWGTFKGGDLLERVMAVLVAQDYPDTTRRVPASGDGGIDLLVPVDGGWEVHQVKGFVDRLGSSERRQITKSLDAAKKNPRLSEPIVRYLVVVPTDLTPGEQQWFDDLKATYPWPCEWRGLLHWDSLAAKHPHVIDYMLGNGADRIRDRSQALQSAVIDPTKPVTAADAGGYLRLLYMSLNKEDPHFRYDLATTMNLPKPSPPQGCVFQRSTSMAGGGYCTVTVFAKHRYALEDCPVEFTLTTKIEDGASADLFKRQLREFEAFGSRLDLPESAEIHVSAPGGLGGTFPMAGGSIEPLPTPGGPPIRLASASPSGETIASILLEATERIRGPGGGGLDAWFTHRSGLLNAHLRLHPRDDVGTGRIDFQFTMDDVVGHPVAPVAELVRFFVTARVGCSLHLLPEHGTALLAATDPLTEDLSPFDERVARYLELLARLQEHAPSAIRVPWEIDGKFARDLDEVVRMWDGEVIQGTWDEIVMPLRPGFSQTSPPPVLVNRSGHLLIEQDEYIEFEGRVISLGTFSTVLSSATLSDDQPDDPQKLRLRPVDDRRVTKRHGSLYPTTG